MDARWRCSIKQKEDHVWLNFCCEEIIIHMLKTMPPFNQYSSYPKAEQDLSSRLIFMAPAVGHVNILKHIMEIYWILILTLLCINVDKIDASDERNYFTRVSSSSLMQEILDPLSMVEHKHDNGIRLISSQLSPISMIK